MHKLCRWFSERLTPQNAKWALIAGEQLRAIASLELLAALVGCVLFGVEGSDRGVMYIVLSCRRQLWQRLCIEPVVHRQVSMHDLFDGDSNVHDIKQVAFLLAVETTVAEP